MPTFRKSPPELIARFDELARLAAAADRRQMFGCPTCVLHGNTFMGLHEDSLTLRLAEADRAEFLSRYHAAAFEAMPGRPMKEYVVVPPSLASDDAVDGWVRRSLAYTMLLPAKAPRKKQADRDLVLRPSRVPVNQDLRNVDHVEGSPRLGPVPPDGGDVARFPMARSTPTRTPCP